jgi:hypothetical protein
VVRFESFVSNDPVRLRSGSFARERLASRATAAALRTLVGIEHEGPCVLGRARSGRASSGVRRGVPDFDGSGDERPEGATPRRRRKHGRAGRAEIAPLGGSLAGPNPSEHAEPDARGRQAALRPRHDAVRTWRASRQSAAGGAIQSSVEESAGR